jgi:hypothetical protein
MSDKIATTINSTKSDDFSNRDSGGSDGQSQDEGPPSAGPKVKDGKKEEGRFNKIKKKVEAYYKSQNLKSEDGGGGNPKEEAASGGATDGVEEAVRFKYSNNDRMLAELNAGTQNNKSEDSIRRKAETKGSRPFFSSAMRSLAEDKKRKDLTPSVSFQQLQAMSLE